MATSKTGSSSGNIICSEKCLFYAVFCRLGNWGTNPPHTYHIFILLLYYALNYLTIIYIFIIPIDNARICSPVPQR